MKIDRESIEPTVAAGWRDPAVRAEFNGNRDAYAAYELAMAKGLARVYAPALGRATNAGRIAAPIASEHHQAQHNVERDPTSGEYFVRSQLGLRLAYDPAWPAERRENVLIRASGKRVGA